MILTCPDCATSYFVDEARVPPQGRTVKCSACGARWRAGRDPEPRPEPEPAAFVEPPAPIEPQMIEAVEATDLPEPQPAPEMAPEDVEIVAEEPAPPMVAPPLRRPAPARKAGGGAAVVWIGMAAVVALTVAGALMFRKEVVRLWPGSSRAFASVGLPANGPGLTIEEVKFQPTFQGGRPVLSVTGAIRNSRTETLTAPALRISLLDKAGQPLVAKVARPLNAEVPGGATRYFAVAIADPPAGSQDLEVAFEPEGAPAAPEAQTVEAVLGPAPLDARPLPAGASEALPDHG